MPNSFSKVFVNSGYAVLRNGFEKDSDYLFVKYGSPDSNHPKNDSHAHCDFLSVDLAIKGLPIFVDSGTYTYNSDRKWRDYFKSTSAHNTVVVNEEEQMNSTNIFAWEEIPKGELLNFKFSDTRDYISVNHSAYKKLSCPIVHQRDIEYYKLESKFIITDLFEGTNVNSLEWFFHLNPEITVKMEGNKFIFYKDNSPIVIMSYKKNISNIQINNSWYSEKYGEKVQRNCIYIKKEHPIGNSFKTSFEIYPVRIN